MSKYLRGLLVLMSLAAACPVAAAEPAPLQPLVDATPDGGILQPPPGVYAGPVVVTRPITIDGDGKVTVTGQGKGTVIFLKGDNISLRGVSVRDSGRRHEEVDSCIRLEGKFGSIKDNEMVDCLFGVSLHHADNNVVRRNHITGTIAKADLRGDGIRLWYSNNNRIEDNVVVDQRDVIFEYSRFNQIRGNSVSGGRYGTHFMYANDNVLEGNSYALNTVAVFSMFSANLQIRHNKITRGNGPDGMGIGLKEASGLIVEDNDIVGNSTGVYLDASPYEPDTTNVFRGNRFGFNGVAMLFHNDVEGNEMRGNDFVGNHSQVVVRSGTALRNIWDGNYWDLYEGFDPGNQGSGDHPFEVYAYADRLWMDVPPAAFFRGSPMMEMLDFLARLAPFSAPHLVLRDSRPAMHKVAEPVG
jgi:nitrous oxidase accessory protein